MQNLEDLPTVREDLNLVLLGLTVFLSFLVLPLLLAALHEISSHCKVHWSNTILSLSSFDAKKG